MKLTVLILTLDLHKNKEDAKHKPYAKKYMPRVCAKIGDKTMIEITIENALRLNPVSVVLYVYKNNIEFINNVLKRKPYSKVLTYMFRENLKFENCNLLVIPGNYPLLSVKSLIRLVSQNRNIKINNNLFYLKNDSLYMFDVITDIPKSNDFIISTSELKKVEKYTDLKDIK